MKLSKRTEYAVRALIHVAKLGNGAYAQSRDLAAQERLPTKFLESVLLGLKRHGYLESKVGSGGGYRLTKPSSKVVVGDLIRKLEGVEEPVSTDLPPDAVQGEAALHLIQMRMAHAQSKVLDQLTLEQLVEEVQKLARSRDAMYYI